ncbi:hypothetical protein FAM18172_02997 [Lacticaseibacillus paracasei]|uniref:Uncharacterized protein n=1 Tax=Lacticaseibacillus paracasei TaxID=1597 RepID=A0A422M2A7_LACPA|nr:hypothetical protein FAM18172_02997 [Lacticaseibacillus paracasei]
MIIMTYSMLFFTRLQRVAHGVNCHTIFLNGIQFTVIMICGETSQILRLIRY